jgi:hypothetical protein
MPPTQAATEQKDDSLDATDIVVGAGVAETAWRFKKQAGWLLRTTWKTGSSLVKRYPYAAAALAAYEALSTEAAQTALADIQTSLGKTYDHVKDWLEDAQRDENVALTSLDSINISSDLEDGSLGNLPADVQRMIPDGVKDAMKARRSATRPEIPTARNRTQKPTTASDMNIATVDAVGRIFGGAYKHDAKALLELQSTIKAFISLSSKELADAVYTIELSRW